MCEIYAVVELNLEHYFSHFICYVVTRRSTDFIVVLFQNRISLQESNSPT